MRVTLISAFNEEQRSEYSITVNPSERGKKKPVNVNSDGFKSLTLGLGFDLNPDSIIYIRNISTGGNGGV